MRFSSCIVNYKKLNKEYKELSLNARKENHMNNPDDHVKDIGVILDGRNAEFIFQFNRWCSLILVDIQANVYQRYQRMYLHQRNNE